MWKSNWEEIRRHFIGWWKQDDLILGAWEGLKTDKFIHEKTQMPPKAADKESLFRDPIQRAQFNDYEFSRQVFPADVPSITNTDIGPGTLALFLGCEPLFDENTVWYKPVFHDCVEPEKLPPLKFNPESKWWKIVEATLKESKKLAEDKYFVGCPDLIENIDILASLRDSQTMMFDTIERPEWVEQKMKEINVAWLEAYQRIYDIIKTEDGSSAFWAYELWGPGKVGKLQSDASAMISSDMFKQFVKPFIKEQCDFLDYSLYHLDGTQAIIHLDDLLSIDSLDAIEWTAQPGLGGGGDPCWHDMYKKILASGKSLQIWEIDIEDIIPLLDEIGGKGVYLLANFKNEKEAEEINKKVESYR
ncbi:hypothetical protein HQ585_18005 [candidate division KSB1 bacterium]|nr:hypothetical protein [candidate division KSB1 bacterium]